MIIEIIDVYDKTLLNGSITIKNGYTNGKIETIHFEDKTVSWNEMLKTNDTYIYEKGDGSISINDQGSLGNDTLKFGANLTSSSIIVKAVKGSDDLIVALKEDGKSFEELSDKITIKNWFKNK